MPIDYSKLHQQALVADLHCDTLLWMRNDQDISIRNTSGHIDIPRLIEGGVNLQVFACFVDEKAPDNNYFKVVNDLIDLMDAELSRSHDKIALCRTGAEAEQVISEGKVAIFIGIENGLAIENSLEKLEYFYNRGVRYMTLTHNTSHDWCTSSFDKNPKFNGLTEFGREVVRSMNRLGIIIDISHISKEAVNEVLKVSTDPVIASHSCVYSISPFPRNLTDDQIKAIAENSGVIGINFCRDFLSWEAAKMTDAYMKSSLNLFEMLNELLSRRYDKTEYLIKYKEITPYFNEWEKQIKKVKTSVKDVIKHIDYIVNLVGPDHVGLGSDFDGIFCPPDQLEDCSRLPNITRELVARNYSEKDIKKILGENFMRVFKRVCDK